VKASAKASRLCSNGSQSSDILTTRRLLCNNTFQGQTQVCRRALGAKMDSDHWQFALMQLERVDCIKAVVLITLILLPVLLWWLSQTTSVVKARALLFFFFSTFRFVAFHKLLF
jgi:hypothetical protein